MTNEPAVLERWRVAKCKRRASVDTSAVYAYGYCAKEDSGFVTPAILKWNDKTAVITTQGGDRFELSGEPGSSRDASLAWDKFVQRHRIQGVEDVSMRYLPKKGRVSA